MSERNYLKTEAVFLAEKTPKKEVVVTPPLREDSLRVTENGTYQAPIGRGYTDVEVNVGGAEPFLVTLTLNLDDDFYTADKTNAEIAEAVVNKTPIYLVNADSIFVVNMMRIIDAPTGESRFRASIPNFGAFETYSDDYDNVTWQIVEDKTIYWVTLTWDVDLGNYVANKTNAEISIAIGDGQVPYLAFTLNDYPQFANFTFASPILLAGKDDDNNLSLFQSQMFMDTVMATLYSDQSLPIATNTNWYLETRIFASETNLGEAIYFPIDLIQPSANSDNFMSAVLTSDIIFYTGSSGGYRIPYITIKLKNSSLPLISTRNLVMGTNGLLCIIYYDPEKSAVCKLTHLPTDVDGAWTRSTL